MRTGFYAGLRRGDRTAFLLGPYATKEEADSNVERAHRAAMEIDLFCHFDTPVTIKLSDVPHLPDGVLNSRIGSTSRSSPSSRPRPCNRRAPRSPSRSQPQTAPTSLAGLAHVGRLKGCKESEENT